VWKGTKVVCSNYSARRVTSVWWLCVHWQLRTQRDLISPSGTVRCSGASRLSIGSSSVHMYVQTIQRAHWCRVCYYAASHNGCQGRGAPSSSHACCSYLRNLPAGMSSSTTPSSAGHGWARRPDAQKELVEEGGISLSMWSFSALALCLLHGDSHIDCQWSRGQPLPVRSFFPLERRAGTGPGAGSSGWRRATPSPLSHPTHRSLTCRSSQCAELI
jgi:hypothetical protein